MHADFQWLFASLLYLCMYLETIQLHLFQTSEAQVCVSHLSQSDVTYNSMGQLMASMFCFQWWLWQLHILRDCLSDWSGLIQSWLNEVCIWDGCELLFGAYFCSVVVLLVASIQAAGLGMEREQERQQIEEGRTKENEHMRGDKVRLGQKTFTWKFREWGICLFIFHGYFGNAKAVKVNFWTFIVISFFFLQLLWISFSNLCFLSYFLLRDEHRISA